MLPGLRKLADSQEHPMRSTLLLYENGVLLEPAHAIHAEIRGIGAGRYSHWNDFLYFSTSDGSDPNSNGRVYQVVYLTEPQDD